MSYDMSKLLDLLARECTPVRMLYGEDEPTRLDKGGYSYDMRFGIWVESDEAYRKRLFRKAKGKLPCGNS